LQNEKRLKKIAGSLNSALLIEGKGVLPGNSKQGKYAGLLTAPSVQGMPIRHGKKK
jgi:hypothetical protein